MSPILMLAATAALGIEVGWEPMAGGGHEYTLQIEPQLLRVLEAGGEEIVSEVPPEIDIRRYRVTVGTGRLPRNAGAPAPMEQPPGQPQAGVADPYGPSDEEPADPYGPPVEPDPAAGGAPSFPDHGGPAEAEQPEEPPEDDALPGGADGGTFGPDAHGESMGPSAPGRLPSDGDTSGPIQPATYDDAQSASDRTAPSPEAVQKPMLPPEEPSRPWGVLLGSVVLLCCSLGANVYLGWIAWEARKGYRNAVTKLRTP